MNIVNTGARFRIFGDEVKTFKSLPVASYVVYFDPMEGYSLISRPDLVVNEDKIYGSHQNKVDKVMKSFSLANRNFGIILSGQKGIGKSLFARLLAQSAIDHGMPVITVNANTPGLSSFLSAIAQECLIIFDEFEKVFGRDSQDEDGIIHSSQEGLLSLFDGLDNGKKLFCITCNNPNDLSSFFINRPGRFHYHFCLSAPTDVEVREYMTDKILPKYADQIELIVRFSQTTHVTYDYLRSIAFEINQGYTLQEALVDLNICNDDLPVFDLVVTFENGEVYKSYSKEVDLYSDSSSYDYFRIHHSDYEIKRDMILGFRAKDIFIKDNVLQINPAKVKLDWDNRTVFEMFGDDCVLREAKKKMPPIPIIKSVVLSKKIAGSYMDKYMIDMLA